MSKNCKSLALMRKLQKKMPVFKALSTGSLNNITNYENLFSSIHFKTN